MVDGNEKKGILVLSDGSIFHGLGFGAEEIAVGELVFNTSMMGYQEALTDPSYSGQILLMTYPLMGNYGTNGTDFESGKVQASAFVVREACELPSHKDSVENIDAYLERNGIPGISGLDTRSIVRRIRERGVMPACVSVYSGNVPDANGLLEKAKALDYSKINFVEKVSLKSEEEYGGKAGKRVVVVDCGVKQSIVRELVARGLAVTVVPWNTDAKRILSLEPDGLLISNGPGDPALLGNVAKTAKSLFGKLPIFGICLGHQIIAHAAGGKTFKLRFGHRGSNHPVKDLETGAVTITSQNHGYAVDERSLPKEFIPTRINLNDRTNEGMRHRELPIFSVQYHPEANPGPYDSVSLFDQFAKMLK